MHSEILWKFGVRFASTFATFSNLTVCCKCRRELCMEGKPCQYTLHPGMPAQPSRCFGSHLLQSIVADPLLPWGLMPGWSSHGPLPGAHASSTSMLAAEAAHEPAARSTQSGMDNRSACPPPGSTMRATRQPQSARVFQGQTSWPTHLELLPEGRAELTALLSVSA